MNLGLKGRHALVIGPSRGLGKAIASAFVGGGMRVAICFRDAGQLATASQQSGAEGLICNLAIPDAADEFIRNVEERLGAIHVLVVNTGGPSPVPFCSLSYATKRSAFESLAMSDVGAIRAAPPSMQTRHLGHVKAVTSGAAKEPVPNLPLSSSLRAGLHGLVNALMPGYEPTKRLWDLNLDEVQLTSLIPADGIDRYESCAATAD
jgi:3-oxoacyl-[acyl-carrier protein] reductase